MEHPDAWPRARDQQARPAAGVKTAAALRWQAARRQKLSAWARRHSGTAIVVVARLMICSFYLNHVASEVETWSHLCSEEERGRMRRWPGEAPPHPAFPAAAVAFLLPVTLLTAANVLLPPLFAALLLLFTVQQDARIVWANARGVMLHGSHPTELLMKQLALIGAAALLLAHSVREAPRLRRVTAGLLRTSDDDDDGQRRRLGTGRSVLLLLGRLLVSALLVYAGYSQMRRMCARAAAAKFVRAGEPTVHHFGRADAHDNNWQLLQCLLALPLALGLRTRRVATLLAATLLLEALLKWGWWGGGWPSWHMRQHYREHWFVNIAASGALLLLQCFGAGELAVDRLLAKQD